MLVGEAFPDRRDGDLRVRCDHRVDEGVQAGQGGGLAADFLPCGRIGGGECFDDGAAADVVRALDRPPGHARTVVAADHRVSFLFRGVGMLDLFPGVAAAGVGLPQSGRAQFREGAQDRVRLAAGQDGQLPGVDGAVAAAGSWEPGVQLIGGERNRQRRPVAWSKARANLLSGSAGSSSGVNQASSLSSPSPGAGEPEMIRAS